MTLIVRPSPGVTRLRPNIERSFKYVLIYHLNERIVSLNPMYNNNDFFLFPDRNRKRHCYSEQNFLGPFLTVQSFTKTSKYNPYFPTVELNVFNWSVQLPVRQAGHGAPEKGSGSRPGHACAKAKHACV